MYIVNIYYSFDSCSPALIFPTEEKATNYIRNDFQYEVEVSEENGNSSIVNAEITSRDDWARIDYEGGDFIEWALADVTDMRG